MTVVFVLPLSTNVSVQEETRGFGLTFMWLQIAKINGVGSIKPVVVYSVTSVRVYSSQREEQTLPGARDATTVGIAYLSGATVQAFIKANIGKS